MDQLNTLSARELSNLNIQGIKVSEPYGTLLGEPERNAVMFIWGEKGAGKSTFSLGLANALADHGRVEYIPAEEHFGKTLVDRVKRLNATHKNLNFTKWKSLEALKDTLRNNRTAFCVLDSITVIEANDKATVELAQWCRENNISFIMVAHATKDGKYKGNTSIAHECDIEIKVTKEGQAEAEKNRYRTLTSIDVPFTATDTKQKTSRSNPTGLKDQVINKLDWLEENYSRYHSDSNVHFADQVLRVVDGEISVDEEEEFLKMLKLDSVYEIDGIDPDELLEMAFNDLENLITEVKSLRANPVEVPFRITLSEIDKLHKVRSWKRANSMFGSKMPCYAKAHSGESESAHLSIRYTPDYNNKKYVLELLLDGRLETQICTEGASGGFKASWRQLVKEYGDLEVMIYSQDHAKKVLGAKEYKRQERKFKKAQKTGNDCPPDQASKSSEKLTDKIKRYNLPEEHRDYFDFPNGTQLVPLEKLVSKKKNPEKKHRKCTGFYETCSKR
ncbi:ATPase/DNA packaging protein [Rhodohalobacter halophilus]|uniref:ATPase/DNA packaging protein n=1 Tax=Rhodohalobacter halophilus TaxID=1812810 RepID=UPI00083FD2AE|nr:ATPase/DNA packaging protein [Rhodohalobacter halophilus]